MASRTRFEQRLGVDDGAARVFNKFLTQWNQSISYGLPVGASAFRLVAEVTINDIDHALAAQGYRFCRYSDDFRLLRGVGAPGAGNPRLPGAGPLEQPRAHAAGGEDRV
jgi:hypothetical protein